MRLHDVVLNPLYSLVVPLCTTRCDIQQFHILPTLCIYMLTMGFRTVTVSLYGTSSLVFYNIWVCFLLGTFWAYIIQCYINEAKRQLCLFLTHIQRCPLYTICFFRRPAHPVSIFYSAMHFTARLVSAVSCPGTTLKTSASRQTKFGALRQCALAGWDLSRQRRFRSHRCFEEL